MRSDFSVPDPSVTLDLESSKCPRQQKRNGGEGPPDRPEPRARDRAARVWVGGVAERDSRGGSRSQPWVPGGAGRHAGAEGAVQPRRGEGGEEGGLRGDAKGPTGLVDGQSGFG